MLCRLGSTSCTRGLATCDNPLSSHEALGGVAAFIHLDTQRRVPLTSTIQAPLTFCCKPATVPPELPRHAQATPPGTRAVEGAAVGAFCTATRELPHTPMTASTSPFMAPGAHMGMPPAAAAMGTPSAPATAASASAEESLEAALAARALARRVKEQFTGHYGVVFGGDTGWVVVGSVGASLFCHPGVRDRVALAARG